MTSTAWASVMGGERSCVSCRWLRYSDRERAHPTRRTVGKNTWCCNHPDARVGGDGTGAWLMAYCHDARGGICGPEGRLYASRLTIWDRLASVITTWARRQRG
jgi:hypothetical protein